MMHALSLLRYGFLVLLALVVLLAVYRSRTDA